MSTERDKMIEELKKWVVPSLRKNSFSGTFPHFRRIGHEQVDLLTFQFNKRGGSFLIEISYFFPNISWIANNLIFNKPIQTNKVTAQHCNIRKRLKSNRFDNVWFYYCNLADLGLGKKHPFIVNSNEKEDFIKNHRKKIKWVQIAVDSIYEVLAKEALECLPEAETWWSKAPYEMRNNKSFLKRLFGRLKK
jgi:hypothetical protein